jgi:hypothetical protein
LSQLLAELTGKPETGQPLNWILESIITLFLPILVHASGLTLVNRIVFLFDICVHFF